MKRLLFVGLIASAGLVGAAAAGGTRHSAPVAARLAPAAEPLTTCSEPLVLGGPTSCKDSTTWYAHAKADCAARGYTSVTILSYPDPCGGGSRYVKYQCCK